MSVTILIVIYQHLTRKIRRLLNSVKRSVQAVDSNAKVDVDLVHKKVRIESTADVDRIKSAVVNAGYPVTSSKVV